MWARSRRPCAHMRTLTPADREDTEESTRDKGYGVGMKAEVNTRSMVKMQAPGKSPAMSQVHLANDPRHRRAHRPVMLWCVGIRSSGVLALKTSPSR